MTIQDEFEKAGVEYAARLDKQREADRLAALTIEARKAGNAALFAQALEEAFTQHDTDDTDTDTDQEN